MIPNIQKRALHRTRIIEGQVRGLQKMIEQEKYCVDIITQNLAIQKSLASLNKLILENHLNTHVKDGISTSKQSSSKIIDELLNLYELTNIRSN